MPGRGRAAVSSAGAVCAALVALVALALTLVATFPAAARAGAGGWGGDGIVRAPGGPYLTDTAGRRLELHGANLVDKCGGGSVDEREPGTPCVGPAQGSQPAYVLSPTAKDPGRRFTAADARTLAGLGFNVVRLGIIWEGLEPGPKTAKPNQAAYCAPHTAGTPFHSLGAADPYNGRDVHAYLARTDTIVRLLAQAGIRVIIDMHSDVYGSAFSDRRGTTPWNGEGAPVWATCTGRYRFRAPPGWGSAYASKAVQQAIHHVFANDVRVDLQGQYARVWSAVASHFRGNPDVVGYEVYNEPDDFLVRNFNPELQCDYGGPSHEPKSCAASHAQALPDGLIGAIESADPSHPVFYEPSGATDYGVPETIGIAEPLTFPRLVLAFHVYGAVPAQLRLTLDERNHTHTDQKDGPAWIMDEFGASNDAELAANPVDWADTMNLSWMYWSAFQLNDPTAGDFAEGLISEQTRQPIVPLAQAVAVPYPWATAGTPGAESYDRATGTYRYTYKVDPTVRAPTEVELPTYTYPFGYTVTVTGARVVSRPDASLLKLSARPHAKQVSVTVTSLIDFPFPNE